MIENKYYVFAANGSRLGTFSEISGARDKAQHYALTEKADGGQHRGPSRPTRLIALEFDLPKHRIDRHKSHIVPKTGTDNDNATDVSEIGKLRALVEPLLKDKEPKIRLAAIGRLESLATLEARLGQDADKENAFLISNPLIQEWITELACILCDTCRAKVTALPPGDTRTE